MGITTRDAIEPSRADTSAMRADALQLISMVRKVGVEGVANDRALRHSALEMLEGADDSVAPALTRIAAAGTRPSYWQYTMSETLVRRIMESPEDKVKRVARVVDALLGDLVARADHGEMQVADAAQLADAVQRGRTVAQHIAFGYDLRPLLDADELDALLLPESGVPGELVFIRVLQCGDVLFAVGESLAESAVRSVKIGRWDLLGAYEDLGWLIGVLTLLGTLLDVLQAGLTKGDWRSMRDAVEEPSVVQSRSYSSLIERVEEMERLLPYPRLLGDDKPSADDFASFAVHVRSALHRVQELLEEWFKKHLGVAKAFNRDSSAPGERRYISPGTPMLAEQRPRFGASKGLVDDVS